MIARIGDAVGMVNFWPDPRRARAVQGRDVGLASRDLSARRRVDAVVRRVMVPVGAVRGGPHPQPRRLETAGVRRGRNGIKTGIGRAVSAAQGRRGPGLSPVPVQLMVGVRRGRSAPGLRARKATNARTVRHASGLPPGAPFTRVVHPLQARRAHVRRLVVARHVSARKGAANAGSLRARRVDAMKAGIRGRKGRRRGPRSTEVPR